MNMLVLCKQTCYGSTWSLGQFLSLNVMYTTKRNERTDNLSVVSCMQNISAWGWGSIHGIPPVYALRRTYLKHSLILRPYKIGPGTHCLHMRWINKTYHRGVYGMTIMRTSRHTNISTADYYSLHTQRKLHHCVTDVKRLYPTTPLFWGNLAHVQTMCTRLFLCDPQNVSGGEPENEANL